MDAASTNTIQSFKMLQTVAAKVFDQCDKEFVNRVRTKGPNIASRYICQFTIELLSRQPGGFQGVINRVASILNEGTQLQYAPSSVCEARKKFPAELFKDLNTKFLEAHSSQHSSARWLGRRLFAVDGSKIILPKQLEKEGFRPEKKESHYPTGKLSVLYEVKTQLIHDMSLNSHWDERLAAEDHFKYLSTKDVVIYDRGYFSYHMLGLHRSLGIDFIIRISVDIGVKAFADFKERNTNKKHVSEIINLPLKSMKKITKAEMASTDQSQTQRVRILKYTFADVEYFLITSLLDEVQFPSEDFPDVYHSRWGVEEIYKLIKQTILHKSFNSTCFRTVCHEIFAASLMANIGRMISTNIEAIPKVKTKKKDKNQGTEKEEKNQTQEVASEQILRLFSISGMYNNDPPRRARKSNRSSH